jgi:nicotinamidase-related amidase
MKSTVLVIDVQQGLCEGTGAASDCDGTIRRINAVTRKARAAGASVIFIQHESASGTLAHVTKGWQLADAHTSAGNDALSPQQVIVHHNITFANITSFGPRVTALRSEDVTFC